MNRNNNIYRFAPPVTLNLMIINTLFWVAELVLNRLHIDLVDVLGLHFFLSKSFKAYQFFTYMFLHDPSGISHLFFNMFTLWMFGRMIETFWGAKRFILFYISCGLSAAFVQEIVWYLMTPSEIIHNTQAIISMNGSIVSSSVYLSLMTTIGASGAIFGLLLAFAMLFPNSRIYFYFLIPIKAKYFMIIYALIELSLGVYGSGNIAHFAHLGGLIGGLILILLWRKKGFIDGPYN